MHHISHLKHIHNSLRTYYIRCTSAYSRAFTTSTHDDTQDSDRPTDPVSRDQAVSHRMGDLSVEVGNITDVPSDEVGQAQQEAWKRLQSNVALLDTPEGLELSNQQKVLQEAKQMLPAPGQLAVHGSAGSGSSSTALTLMPSNFAPRPVESGPGDQLILHPMRYVACTGMIVPVPACLPACWALLQHTSLPPPHTHREKLLLEWSQVQELFTLRLQDPDTWTDVKLADEFCLRTCGAVVFAVVPHRPHCTC